MIHECSKENMEMTCMTVKKGNDNSWEEADDWLWPAAEKRSWRSDASLRLF